MPDGGAAIFARAWSQGWQIPKRLTVSEWADQYRILPRKAAAEYGQYRTSRTPYARDIADDLSIHSQVTDLTFMKPTQIGATEIGNNWLGYIMHHAPASLMLVQPTVEMAERWSKQKFQPMIESTPVLNRLVKPARSRDSGNTTLLKEFPNGLVVASGANSSASMRSLTVRYLFLDEVDAYPDNVEEEGDPVDILRKRTLTFSTRAKHYYVSTPTIKGASRIEKLYLDSDQRRYYVPCPHCQHMQVLQFGGENTPYGLKWPAGEPAHTKYMCENQDCHALIDELHKSDMLAAGQWRPSNPAHPKRGYHINALYAPVGLGMSWGAIAQEFLDARASPEKLQVFVNTILAETWDAEATGTKPEVLQQRAQDYPLRSIPRGCLLLTASVDVQDNRFAIQVLGHGRHERIWVIDYIELPCDPSRDESWEMLAEYLQRPFTNSFGVQIKIRIVSVDTGGHHHHEVVNFARMRKHLGVIAVKGYSTNRPQILNTRPTKVEYNLRGKPVVGGGELWMVGVDHAKSTIIKRIFGDATVPPESQKIIFSRYLPEEYYKQLLAETYDPTKKRWVNRKNLRNEALDTFVYAYAAAMHPYIRINAATESDWAKLESVLEPQQLDLLQPAAFTPNAEVVPADESPPDQSAVFSSQPKPASSGLFVGRRIRSRGLH